MCSLLYMHLTVPQMALILIIVINSVRPYTFCTAHCRMFFTMAVQCNHVLCMTKSLPMCLFICTVITSILDILCLHPQLSAGLPTPRALVMRPDLADLVCVSMQAMACCLLQWYCNPVLTFHMLRSSEHCSLATFP